MNVTFLDSYHAVYALLRFLSPSILLPLSDGYLAGKSLFVISQSLDVQPKTLKPRTKTIWVKDVELKR